MKIMLLIEILQAQNEHLRVMNEHLLIVGCTCIVVNGTFASSLNAKCSFLKFNMLID